MKSIDGRLELIGNRVYLDCKPTNFLIQELVPSKIYKKHKEHCLLLLNSSAVQLLQFTRDFLGVPLTVNNWYFGGKYNYRGYRPLDTLIGALNSMHKWSGAWDFSCSIPPDEVRRIILENQETFMAQGLTRIEDGAFAPTWVHIDLRNTGLEYIKIVKPYRPNWIQALWHKYT